MFLFSNLRAMVFFTVFIYFSSKDGHIFTSPKLITRKEILEAFYFPLFYSVTTNELW